MATVNTIGRDALMEIGVLDPTETMTSEQAALVLLRFQNQLDAWQADRLTLSVQSRTTFTLASGTSTVTLGPTGADVTMQRPVWLNSVNYVIPGTNPAVESPIGIMDEDAYANISIKALSSALPMQCFYNTSITASYGSLFFWPQVSQNVTIALYVPQAVGVPAALTSTVSGPPGYQEAFMYQLAIRLMTPFGVKASDVPMLLGPEGLAAKAFATMKRPNVSPGVLGIDAALVPNMGAGYNVLSDNMTAPSNR